MKRVLVVSSVGLMLYGMLLTSCSESNDYVSRSPVYKNLTLNPNPVNAGQKVQGLVEYTDPGEYLTSCDYQFTLSDGTSYNWHQVSPTESQPEFSFFAPAKPGNYTVTFNATKINFSANGEQGTIFGSANTVRADLKVNPCDVINANWGDRKDDLLNKIDVTDSASLLVWKGQVILIDEGSTDMAKDTLNAQRIYHFDTSGLNRVEQTACRTLIAKSTYNTAMEEWVLDSLVNNFKAAIDLMGLTYISNLDGFAIESNDDITLTGPHADLYPVASWTKYSDKQKTELVRAFWRGDIERYQVVMYSERSKCVASVLMDIDPTTGKKDNLVLKWEFLPL